MTRCAVYRFFSADNALLYVGRSYDPFRRWATHSGDKVWIEEVARMEPVWFGSLADAVQAEADAIRNEQPRYNDRQPTGRQRPRVVSGRGPDLLNELCREARKSHDRADWQKVWRIQSGLGVGGSMFADFLAGRRCPTPEQASRIAALTSGAVPAASWTTPHSPARHSLSGPQHMTR